MKQIILPVLVLSLLTGSPSLGDDRVDGTDSVDASPAVKVGDQALCPVCHVHGGETELEKVAAVAEHDGRTYGFCSVGCRDKFAQDPVGYLPPVLPRPAPPFHAVGLQGEELSLESLRGRVVLLDFWATWCAPCVADLPRLSELHSRYAERGLSVVGLSIDEGDKAERQVAKMIQRKKASHPVALDGGEQPAWAAYHVRSVPAQFLIDGDGRIVAQWLGKTDLAAVEQEILKLLAPAPQP